MLFSLLEETPAAPENNGNGWVSYVLIGVLAVILIVSMIVMNRRSKKREQEAQDLINAVKPGNKVKTIGGICGIVVEVNESDDTFVLETGSETSGKCYMKFVRQAILESDAVAPKTDSTKKEKAEESAEAPAEKAEEPATEAAEATVEKVDTTEEKK